MSRHVATVRIVVDAINRADVDAVIEGSTEDFELDFSNSRGPMSGVYRGPKGIRAFFDSFLEPWASLEFAPEEMVDLSEDRILLASEIRMRGSESGAAVSARGATIWTIRDGKVAAVKLFQSKEEALEAASAQL